MRLSDVLSKMKSEDYSQIEGFLGERRLQAGKQKKIAVGRIAASYYCKQCEDDLSFISGDELFCVGVNDHLISIDCVLSCPRCGASVPVWYLVESRNVIHSSVPYVRVIKHTERLTDSVGMSSNTYGVYSEQLAKADRAYRDGLGAGSVIYLRKIFEDVVYQTASAAGIEITQPNAKRKPFKQVLEAVEKQCDIIPNEFEDDAYRLFGELSSGVHGYNDEEKELQNYYALRRLVIGVLDRIKNNRELTEAIGILGWNQKAQDKVS